MAARYNLPQFSEKILDNLKKKHQLSAKAFLFMEYTKAELAIRLTKSSNSEVNTKDFEIE